MTQKQIAYERDAKNLCIVCGEAATGRRRGLCTKDYERYRTALKSIPSGKREEWESLCVERGLLMPNRQGRPPVTDDVFAELSAEFLNLPDAATASYESGRSALDTDAIATGLADMEQPPQDAPPIQKKAAGQGRKKRATKKVAKRPEQ